MLQIKFIATMIKVENDFENKKLFDISSRKILCLIYKYFCSRTAIILSLLKLHQTSKLQQPNNIKCT